MKTEIDELIEYGISIPKRKIYIGLTTAEDAQEITMESIEKVVKGIHKMVELDQNKPIELHVCSPGGDAYAALWLYDEIQACPAQIVFIGGGLVASAATLIMVGCDERRLHPNTSIMLHDGQGGTEGKVTDVQIDAKEDKRLQDLYDRLYAENSRMPREFFQDVLQRDLWITAGEAVSMGLADSIVEPKKRGNLRKVRQHILKKPANEVAMNDLIFKLYERINRTLIPTVKLNTPVKEPEDPTVVIVKDADEPAKV